MSTLNVTYSSKVNRRIFVSFITCSKTYSNGYFLKVYQSSRVPASSPPVSSSAASASSQGGSTSSAVSSTSGLGSSASSTSTGLSNSLGGGNNGSSGGNNSGNGSSNSGLSADQLSRTNLYIRGLTQNTTDKDLLALCAP